MSAPFDVVVIGGGPAGAVVSLRLAQLGRRVALFEATAFERERYGETLPPEINPALRELGLWEAFQRLAPLEAPGMVSVWGDWTPTEVDFMRNVHGTGWHIDRNRFDEMLCNEAIKAGADVFLNRRAPVCLREHDEWHVDGLRAGALVDASGRNGLRLDDGNRRDQEDMLLAIVSRIAHDETGPKDLRTSIEATTCGWWYTALLPGGDSIAMFFTDREVYTSGVSVEEELENAPMTKDRLRSGRLVASRVVPAPSFCRKALYGDGWVAVGDSASSYDPLSGRGIFKGLRHGAAAADALHARMNGDEGAMVNYAKRVRHEFDQYSRQRQLHYAAERRFAECPFWQARRGP